MAVISDTGTCLVERTVDCQSLRCSSYTPPFVSYNLPIQPRPLYCPKCSKPRTLRPYDYADVLCTDNAGLTRKQATKIIAMYNEQSARGVIKPSTVEYDRGLRYTIDPIDYFNDMGGKGLPALRSFITPLDVNCHACGGSYTLLRNVPDVQRTPPLYCIWCASPNVTVNQQDTEDTAWTCLATHYNLPLNFIKVLYERWNTRSNKTTFKDYMESPLIKQLLEEVAS